MPIHNAPADVKLCELSIVITRADGTVEDLGVVSQYHKNPLINDLKNRWIKVKEFMRKDK